MQKNGSSKDQSLRIKQDDKFFRRLLTKEASVGKNSSFRVYYGGASGSVPFRWESQPGTPKHTLSDRSSYSIIPPLTPPPSYYSDTSIPKSLKKCSKPNLLTTIFPKFMSSDTPKRTNMSPSSSLSSVTSSSLSSWSSSRSSLSCTSSPMANSSKRRGLNFSGSRTLSEFCFRDDYNIHEHASDESCSSALCFGNVLHKPSSGSSSLSTRGNRYRMVNVKAALLSVVGHGSGRGTT